MTTTALLQDIADKLDIDAGLVVTVEYPGFLSIPHATQAGLCWAFGTANGTWQGDLMTDNGAQVFETVDTGVSGDETDPGVIALAIAKSLL